MANKIINDNKETEKSCHYERSKVMTKGEMSNTSPQPSPRGEGAVVGEHKANHTNSGEVKKAAFTLAETMIVLVTLGIVAALTIPSLVKNQTETANRSKLKKAMAAYEKAINQMLIDNELETESAFKSWAKRDAQNGYTKERSYFKIAQESTSSPNCRFKTGDGIWWDFCGTNDSNIEKTIVFFDKNYKDTPRTGDNGLEALAKINKDANGKKIFVFAFVGHRSPINGSVIVNDKSFEETQENNNENIQFTVKTIVFLKKEEDKVEDEPTTKCSENDIICKYNNNELDFCTDEKVQDCISEEGSGTCYGEGKCYVYHTSYDAEVLSYQEYDNGVKSFENINYDDRYVYLWRYESGKKSHEYISYNEGSPKEGQECEIYYADDASNTVTSMVGDGC